MTFRKKRGCGSPPVTVEPPSPAAQRCTNGTQNGPHGNGRQRGGTIKSEVIEAGRAEEDRAHTVTFVLYAL